MCQYDPRCPTMNDAGPLPAEVEDVMALATRLGYGRGGARGCVVPFEQLARLRETLTGEELVQLVEKVRQADAEREAADAAQVAAAPSPRSWRDRWLPWRTPGA